MEMEVGDDGAAGPSRLGYYKHQTASFSYSKRNTCHARLTCTRIVWREAKMRMRIPSNLFNKFKTQSCIFVLEKGKEFAMSLGCKLCR